MTPVRRLLVGHALAAVAMSMPWPLLVLLVWQRGGTDLAVGVAGAARMLPYVALSWVAGSLADRVRRDRIVRAGLVARAALLAVTAVATAQGWLWVAVIAASAAVACGTPAFPALAAAMPAAAGPDRRRATGLLVTIEVAAFVVGPALGGLLLFTGAWLPALAAVLTAAALPLMAGVVLPRPVAGPGPAPSARAVVATARRGPGVPRAIATVAALNGVLAAVGLALLPWAAEVRSRNVWPGDIWPGDSGYGVATGVLGLGALAAPLLWWLGRSAAGRTRLGLLALASALLLVPLAPGLFWALPLLAVVGAAGVHVEGAATETIQDGVPDARRAGTLGLTDSVMVAAAMLGSLVAPWLASRLGPGGLLTVLALACVAAAVVPTGVVRAGRPGDATAGAVSVPRQREPARPGARSWSAAAPRG